MDNATGPATDDSAYTLTFEPRLVEKVWGGRKLEDIFGRRLAGTGPIGEVWTVWDGLAVKNGKWRGHTLADVGRLAGVPYLGQPLDELPGCAFPLLVKFLDARENLSIQVHPDDAYARTREGQPFGKSEMWYILDAAPGARVYHGVNRDLSAADLQKVFRDRSAVDVLAEVAVQPGDVLINMPGTVHALGGGVVLYELQQSCDLTYRLYDWDRGTSVATPRELHLEKGIEVIDARPHQRHKIEPVVLDDPDHDRAILCACRYFVAERWIFGSRVVIQQAAPRFRLVTVIAGRCRVRSGTQGAQLPLQPGESALLPAALGSCDLEATDGSTTIILAYVPDLVRDVVQPLRVRGIPDEQIAQLGGDFQRSDLLQYLG